VSEYNTKNVSVIAVFYWLIKIFYLYGVLQICAKIQKFKNNKIVCTYYVYEIKIYPLFRKYLKRNQTKSEMFIQRPRERLFRRVD
jgi:hypothetical protein